MSNDFAAIGLDINSDTELANFYEKYLFSLAGRTDLDGERYELLATDDKAELRFFFDGETPIKDYAEISYNSGNYTEVEIKELISEEDEIPAVFCVGSGFHRFFVTVPNASDHRIGVYDKCRMDLTLIANNAFLFRDAEDYLSGGRHTSHEHLFPLLCEDGTYARIAGTAVKVEKRRSSLGGYEYYEITLFCAGTVFTALAAKEIFDRAPKKGNIVVGEFFVTGKIVEEADEDGKTIPLDEFVDDSIIVFNGGRDSVDGDWVADQFASDDWDECSYKPEKRTDKIKVTVDGRSIEKALKIISGKGFYFVPGRRDDSSQKLISNCDEAKAIIKRFGEANTSFSVNELQVGDVLSLEADGHVLRIGICDSAEGSVTIISIK